MPLNLMATALKIRSTGFIKTAHTISVCAYWNVELIGPSPASLSQTQRCQTLAGNTLPRAQWTQTAQPCCQSPTGASIDCSQGWFQTPKLRGCRWVRSVWRCTPLPQQSWRREWRSRVKPGTQRRRKKKPECVQVYKALSAHTVSLLSQSCI